MTAKTHSPISVANYLLKKDKKANANAKGNGKGNGMEKLKLIKLVYLCHGWSLGFFDEPLVNEKAEAWDIGPVFPSLYRATKEFGDSPIKSPLGEGEMPDFDDHQKETVDLVYKKYHHLSGIQLMRLSLEEETPWYKVWLKNDYTYAPISDTLIQRYFGGLLENA